MVGKYPASYGWLGGSTHERTENCASVDQVLRNRADAISIQYVSSFSLFGAEVSPEAYCWEGPAVLEEMEELVEAFEGLSLVEVGRGVIIYQNPKSTQ